MNIRLLLLVGLLSCAGDAGGQPAPGADNPANMEEQILRKARISTDTAGLLTFLRSRSPDDASPERLAQMVRALGSTSFQERERAGEGLVTLGAAARRALLVALNSPDAEVVSRAKKALDQVNQELGLDLPSIVVRILIQRRPAG